MITKNFINVVATLIQSNYWSGTSMLPVTAVDGNTYYLSGRYTDTVFPGSISSSYRSGSSNQYENPGIYLGHLNTTATVNDYRLAYQEHTLSRGNIWKTNGMTDGNPYVQFRIVVDNDDEEKNPNHDDVVIQEVGYFQRVNVCPTQGQFSGEGTSNYVSDYYGQNVIVLFDRTVLDQQVVVPWGYSRTIIYKIHTIMPQAAQSGGE